MKGIVYIATGLRFYDAAAASARSVRRHSPALGIHIFTDVRAEDTSPFDAVEIVPDPHRRSKVDYLPRTPFDETLYLDADTRVCGDISGVFDLLERFDISMVHAQNRIKTAPMRWRRDLPYAFPQFNAGVMLFDGNMRVKQLLQDWKKHFHQAGFKKDQTTLRELLWESDLRIGVLPPEFNVKHAKYVRMWSKQEAQPLILHYEKFVAGNRRLDLVRTVGRTLLPEKYRSGKLYNNFRSTYSRVTGHQW